MGFRCISSIFNFGIIVFHIPVCLAIEPDFEIEIAPILEANCLSCHNQEEAEGDLVLETRSLALEHPDAIIPGHTSGRS